MTAPATGERRGGSALKRGLLKHLHDPLEFRLCVIAVVLTTGYFAVYSPLNDQITATTNKLKRDAKLLELAESIERLQKQYHSFGDRVPQQTDTKEWMEYLLNGIRQLPLKMAKIDCIDPKAFGPYRVVVFQIELEGSFYDADKFLAWLESNSRLLRVDAVRISPSRSGNDSVTMHLNVLGLTS